MASQVGQITEIKTAGRVQVSFTKAAMCSHGSCNHRILPDMGNTLEVDAQNPIGAGMGDVVEVSFETDTALKAAFMVYLFPIIVGLLIYVVGDTISLPFTAPLALAGVAGTMTYGLYKGKHIKTQYIINRRLNSEEMKTLAQQDCASCPLK